MNKLNLVIMTYWVGFLIGGFIAVKYADSLVIVIGIFFILIAFHDVLAFMFFKNLSSKTVLVKIMPSIVMAHKWIRIGLIFYYFTFVLALICLALLSETSGKFGDTHNPNIVIGAFAPLFIILLIFHINLLTRNQKY